MTRDELLSRLERMERLFTEHVESNLAVYVSPDDALALSEARVALERGRQLERVVAEYEATLHAARAALDEARRTISVGHSVQFQIEAVLQEIDAVPLTPPTEEN